MKYIATILLVFMTVTLVISGILLWKRRKEASDYSRIIWAVFSWISAFFTLTFIMRTWQETTTADGAFFEPEHTFVPILMQMTFFLYPLEVIRPTISRAKVYVLLFTPLILLLSVGMCAVRLAQEQVDSRDGDSTVDSLWKEINLLLDNNDKWRDPNLSLSSLSEQLASNRTYVGEAFKRNARMTFIEYLTKRRIGYVIDALQANPKADIHELLNYVGYRQRSTAWRNFQKITGMTPTEFVDNLK